MSSSISSFRICNVQLPISSSSSKGNGGSNSILPISVKTPAKPKHAVGIAMASNGKTTEEATSRDSLDHLQRVSPQHKQPRKRTPQSQGASPVVIWDKLPTARTVQQMMDTMERLMEDPFAYGTTNWASTPAAENNGYRRGRTPWAIKETETGYKIRYDMPGMTKNDVKVWVEEKMLVLKADKAPKKSQDGQVDVVTHTDEEDEWPAESYGKYNTRIALPELVEIKKIKAEVKDGVLYITIPKASETTKKIDISVQ